MEQGRGLMPVDRNDARTAFDAGHALGFAFGIGWALANPEDAKAFRDGRETFCPTAAECDRVWAMWQSQERSEAT